jgi:hypothetical protein
MVLYVDVLGFIMESRILGQLDCISIFNQKRNGIHLFLLQIFKYFLGHAISFVSFAFATYLSFVLEFVGTDYLCDLQETIFDQRIMRYPKVETPFSLFPSRSKS